MSGTYTQELTAAAEAALRAPSIFNIQPWHWRVTGDALELSADPTRQLPVVDPDHRLTTISCGIALHHARTALAAEGHTVRVDRLPDPAQPDLLARITITGSHSPDPADIRRYEASRIRHTDRRVFSDQPVPADALNRLTKAARPEGAHLHPVRDEDVPTLAAVVTRAQRVELGDEAYREELARWTDRPGGSGDGVPRETVTGPARRTVPVRDFEPSGEGGLAAGEGTDNAASYAILAGDSDDRLGWLRAGEAMSAVLLTAVTDGLSVSPMSDAAEVGATRELLHEMLAGIGYPFLVLRIGVAEPTSGVPATPRRSADEVIEADG